MKKIFKILSGLITIGGLIFGILGYASLKPELEFQKLSYTTLINPHDKIASLKIFVDTIDIQNANLNIGMMTIKVCNKGYKSIKKTDFDGTRFGLILNNASLLEPPTIIDASSEYLINRFNEYSDSLEPHFISIPQLPFDKNDYITVKFSILLSNNSQPNFEPYGKISGQRRLI